MSEAPHLQEGPSSFTFAMDAAQTADDLPDYESLDEHDDDQKLGNILPEDSTFALIFRSPVKHASPAKVDYPMLPHSDGAKEQLDTSPAHLTCEEITFTGLSVESVVAEVAAHVSTSTVYTQESGTERAGDTNTMHVEMETTAVESESLTLQSEDADEVAYPTLPAAAIQEPGELHPEEAERAVSEDEEDAEMSEIRLGSYSALVQTGEITNTTEEINEDQDSADEEFTEASMQLNIQDDYEKEGVLASQPPTPKAAGNPMHDITAGLTLSLTPAKASPREHTPKRLHSPPPPLRIESGPDDATMTIAIDDDTAILKSFLSRAAASKAERSANITRRESLENRRDSDIVRHALASPRKALEEKDPNSPSKTDSEVTLDLSGTPVLSPEMEESASPSLEEPEEDATDAKTGRGSRRSARAKKSRLPAPASTTQPQASNKIAIRRADGTDPVILKKTDAQELALITKNNTRKNKQGAFMVSLRLLKLQAEAILSPSTPLDDETPREPVPGRRGIRWDETLAYYQEHADTIAAQQAEAESLATPDELSLPASGAAPSTKKSKVKTPLDKTSTPKIRRVRGLGTANGTPGKGLLATGSLLPDAVAEEKITSQSHPLPQPPAKSIPKPKPTRKLPGPATPAPPKPAALDPAPVSVEPVKERRSRLATPKSVGLLKPRAGASAASSVEKEREKEKENARVGLSGATPRKGIPAPRVVASKSSGAGPAGVGVGVESGLPRRRGRKV